jgi:hypothetical protein
MISGMLDSLDPHDEKKGGFEISLFLHFYIFGGNSSMFTLHSGGGDMVTIFNFFIKF